MTKCPRCGKRKYQQIKIEKNSIHEIWECDNCEYTEQR